ncbi:hypothetical protein G3I51_13425 [Streptomyces sp. SID9944]|nr:hypothetical protein [Streptomyces sp. SID9944]
MSATKSARAARLAQLLITLRARPGHHWTVGEVHTLRRQTGGPTQRNTSHHDMQELHRRGHLAQHGPTNGRSYTLTGQTRCPVCGHTFEDCTCTGSTPLHTTETRKDAR